MYGKVEWIERVNDVINGLKFTAVFQIICDDKKPEEKRRLPFSAPFYITKSISYVTFLIQIPNQTSGLSAIFVSLQ